MYRKRWREQKSPAHQQQRERGGGGGTEMRQTERWRESECTEKDGENRLDDGKSEVWRQTELRAEARRWPRCVSTRSSAASASSRQKEKEKENYNSVMFCCITGSASRTPGQLLTSRVIRRLAASHFVGLGSPPRILVITCTVFVCRGLFGAR